MPATTPRIFPYPLALALSLGLTGACDDGASGEAGGDATTAADDTGGAPGSTGDDDPTGSSGGTGDDDELTTSGSTGDEDTTSGSTGDEPPADGVLDLPKVPYDYTDELPPHYRTPIVGGFDNTPPGNPITDAGATLGRVLFYDVALSKTETVACATCHAQSTGFSDTAKFSEGFAGGLTGRNSMPLADARFNPSGAFFWDERAATLEEQVLGPIQNEVEMGLTLAELVERVGERPYYADLFTAAFGDDEVTTDRIARALAQFVRAMTAHRTRYDEGIAAVGDIRMDFPNYTASENLGKQIFLGPRGRCAPCHLAGPPPGPMGFPNQAIFQPLAPLNNGLDAGPTADNGVGDVTGVPADDGKFKSPSLRNIALTGPYMHDGRFATLGQVVDHYDHGVKPHPNLDPRLRGPNNQPQQLGLTAAEKAALVDFLGTLTDEALVVDPRFADPFVH